MTDKPKHTILVTGGAGYIGSTAAHALCDLGLGVVVVDDLTNGDRRNLPKQAVFVEGDIGDAACLEAVFADHSISAVMHFAGSVVVPESVANPALYYRNNTANSLRLAQKMLEVGCNRLLFSSTAAVYGIPHNAEAIPESAPCQPINPYGKSKYMTEIMLGDLAQAQGLQAIILRYFNVAGADDKARCGQSNPDATHLIKRACRVALGKDAALSLFGSDYPTADGSAVRDYIHVNDLIDAHVLGLQQLLADKKATPPPIYNCGYGHGYSVREVIAAMEKVTGRKLPVVEAPRRVGDPPLLVADSTAIKNALGWQPKRDDLHAIIASALAWEEKLP